MTRRRDRDELVRTLGMQIVGFQEATADIDSAAAATLSLDRADLPSLTLLLYRGPTSVRDAARVLGHEERDVRGALERAEMAGYVRRVPAANGDRFEVTEHARDWIATLWGPLQKAGEDLMGRCTTQQLAFLTTFLAAATRIQAKHLAKLRAQLEVRRPHAKSALLRGGLSPAALRRVRVFVESNLGRTLAIAALDERAGLSEFHFARSFKRTMGTTPRAFVEQRRIERAKQLIAASDDSLALIAVETGFGTQSRLTTAFRRATGFTPAVYRRGVRSSDKTVLGFD